MAYHNVPSRSNAISAGFFSDIRPRLALTRELRCCGIRAVADFRCAENTCVFDEFVVQRVLLFMSSCSRTTGLAVEHRPT